MVGDFQGSNQLSGFFIQEEDADADADPSTSEGIFVFCQTCPVAVQVGDRVSVTGNASDFFGMSQLSATTLESVEVLSSGNPLPTPATIALPVPDVPAGDLNVASTAINAYFESFEGMLVTFPDTLVVAEFFGLDRYGELLLAAGGRPRQFTDQNPPDAANFIDHQIDLARRSIVLDDDNNLQNAAEFGNTPYFWPRPGLSADNFFRGGDTITALTGVLHWSFSGASGTDAWRIRPVEPAFSYDFTSANPRPPAPDVAGSLRVASFNALNYFLTIDTTASSSSGICGPALNAECRGADSEAELARQREKLTQALLGLNAEVIGLVDLENTPDVEPLAAIVSDLNVESADTWAYIDTGVIGTDVIRVGIIYNTAIAAPVGNHAVLDVPAFVDPLTSGSPRNLPSLAQTFTRVSDGGHVTVVVNQFKSRGSACGVGDDDTTTGQGNCNGTRTAAAQALVDWLATDPTASGDTRALITGELNAYRFEDPINVFKEAGYVDLINAFQGPDAYGYLLSGQLGYIDHALASADLLPNVVGAAQWHINADEVREFDYNDAIQDTSESSFERRSGAEELYSADPYRTSDHDPLVVGLHLLPPITEVTLPGPGASSGEGIAGDITVRLTGGWEACSFGHGEFAPLSGEAANTAPAGFVFPAGLFDFSVSNCTPGSTITVEITYPQPLPEGGVYWKYGRTQNDPSYHWYQLPDALISGNTVTFSITDGGLGDNDLTANGTIIDPSGPGFRGSANAIPTLAEWALLLMAGLMGLFGVAAMRRRRAGC